MRHGQRKRDSQRDIKKEDEDRAEEKDRDRATFRVTRAKTERQAETDREYPRIIIIVKFSPLNKVEKEETLGKETPPRDKDLCHKSKDPGRKMKTYKMV